MPRLLTSALLGHDHIMVRRQGLVTSDMQYGLDSERTICRLLRRCAIASVSRPQTRPRDLSKPALSDNEHLRKILDGHAVVHGKPKTSSAGARPPAKTGRQKHMTWRKRSSYRSVNRSRQTSSDNVIMESQRGLRGQCMLIPRWAFD